MLMTEKNDNNVVHGEKKHSLMALFSENDRRFLFGDDRQHWQLMLEHIPAAIAVFDSELRYLATTRRWLADYKLQDQVILGRCHYDVFPDIPQRWKDIHQNCLMGKTDSCDEDPFPREDGGTAWIKWQIQPWYQSDKTVGGIVMFTEVITAQKELQQFNLELETRVIERTRELSIAKEKAEAASQAKSDFLSHMSHELRTPLNAILGYTQLLESDSVSPPTEEQAENIDEILKAGRHLFTLIDEVLDLSAIESGSLPVISGKASLQCIILESLSMVKECAQRHAIELHNNIEACPKIVVKTDTLRLRQIVMNLLTNAIKYNKNKGCVRLKSELVNNNHVRLSISDTGQGIPASDIEIIFHPFERSIQKHSQIEGTGIGLPLCKKLAEAMDCKIGVKSELDKGSEFWIDIPLA
jgi:PAS domain S-box-containing protein